MHTDKWSLAISQPQWHFSDCQGSFSHPVSVVYSWSSEQNNFFLSLWCLTLPVTKKKKIGTDRENVPSSSLLQLCSEQTDVKLVPAAGAASLEFDKVCAFLSALYRFCAKLFGITCCHGFTFLYFFIQSDLLFFLHNFVE